MLIARGLAEQTGKRIRLSTKAIVGATSAVQSMRVRGHSAAGCGVISADEHGAQRRWPSAAAGHLLRRLRAGRPGGGRHAPTSASYRHPAAAARRCAHRGVRPATPKRQPSGGRCRCRRIYWLPNSRAMPELMFSADRYHRRRPRTPWRPIYCSSALRDALTSSMSNS